MNITRFGPFSGVRPRFVPVFTGRTVNFAVSFFVVIQTEPDAFVMALKVSV